MLKYIGDGAFIPDLKGELVPARDLTDEEVAHFGEKELIASGLYARVDKARAAQVTTRKSMDPGGKAE